MGPLALRNRIVMAPLTRSRAADGNAPHPLNALYYAQRASAGLIIAEATQISPQGQGYIRTPGIHSPAQVDGWRTVTRAVHAAGGSIFLQLWHVGRISHRSFQPDGAPPVAPSAIRAAGQVYTEKGFEPLPTPRALELREIPQLVEDYARAARNALQAGFDGVEVHAANGYLIDQFLRDSSNHRTDAYGGSVENRTRLLIEVVDAVAASAGADRTGVRISPQNTFNDLHDADPQRLFEHVAKSLSGKSLAYLHVVEGDQMKPPPAFDYARLKGNFDGLYIANQNYDKARANLALSRGTADLVAFGKLFISNADLVTRFLLDAPLAAGDEATYYGGDARGYTDYPVLTTAS
ncbi:MAG: alkene reductase [Steroidobacteraceae bacterium]